MSLLALIIVLAANIGTTHADHPTCRRGSISVSFETAALAKCFEYCGTRYHLTPESSIEIAMDRCATPATFMSEGTGPYEIPPERDSFGTAHVHLR